MPIEEEEGSKVCGLCSNLVDKGVTLSDDMLEYFIQFLNIQGQYLPTKVCEECYKSSDMCKTFMDKCRQNISKLKNNKLSTSMILGRSRQDIRLMKEKFKNSRYNPMLVDFDEQVGKVSSRGRTVKSKYSPNSLFEDNVVPDPDRIARQNAKKLQKVDPDLKKVDDNEEIFPSVGPYQCEICQKISDTKREFVNHIKELHREIVDSSVLKTLEADLRKRKKKGLDMPKRNSGSAKKKSSKKKRSTPKKKKTNLNSDESDEDGDCDDDYVPGGKKRKHGSLDGTEEDAPVKKSGGVNCDICGQRLSRAKDLPKHKTSQTCRRIAAEMEAAGTNPTTENGENIKTEGGEESENKDLKDIKKEKTDNEEGEGGDGGDGGNGGNGGEGGEGGEANDKGEGPGVTENKDEEIQEGQEGQNAGGEQETDAENAAARQNSLDAKFKANIAKRYEAEIGSDDSRAPSDQQQGEDQKGEDGDEPGANDNEENDAEKSEEQQRQELVERIAETEQEMDNILNNAEGVGETDFMETQSQSTVPSEENQGGLSSLAAAAGNFKPWTNKDARNKESTIDFSSIETNHLSNEAVEDIETQMAALHGNGIGNRGSPWDI